MKKWLALALAIPLLITAMIAAWVAMPSYIELRIPVAPQATGSDFWREQQYSSLNFAHVNGTVWLTRQVGTAYPETQGWTSAPDILDFFDTELRERGWRKLSNGGSDALLPESRLIDKSLVRTYIRPEDSEPPARVFVAAWPVKGANAFHVVLETANPSLPYRLAHGFLD
jgi:hypothetical protein